MYVTGIEIAGFRRRSTDGRIDGSVVLVGDGTRMQIPLTLNRRVELRAQKDRLLLLARALRELRRVPEYRDTGALRFAPGLLPAELARRTTGSQRRSPT